MSQAITEALRAYEAAWDDLFGQCCSNPITNAWGKQVSVDKLNDAHQLAQKALRAAPAAAQAERTIDASLTISRDSNDVMKIRIQDKASRVAFVQAEISPRDMMMALTGLSHVDCKAKVQGLEHVGKHKVIETRTAKCPLKTYDKGALVAWLEENCQEPGWILSTYLGSHGSVDHTSDGTVLRYSVYRYQDDPPQKL